jgi:hypothetical protein
MSRAVMPSSPFAARRLVPRKAWRRPPSGRPIPRPAHPVHGSDRPVRTPPIPPWPPGVCAQVDETRAVGTADQLWGPSHDDDLGPERRPGGRQFGYGGCRRGLSRQSGHLAGNAAVGPSAPSVPKDSRGPPQGLWRPPSTRTGFRSPGPVHAQRLRLRRQGKARDQDHHVHLPGNGQGSAWLLRDRLPEAVSAGG